MLVCDAVCLCSTVTDVSVSVQFRSLLGQSAQGCDCKYIFVLFLTHLAVPIPGRKWLLGHFISAGLTPLPQFVDPPFL